MTSLLCCAVLCCASEWLISLLDESTDVSSEGRVRPDGNCGREFYHGRHRTRGGMSPHIRVWTNDYTAKYQPRSCWARAGLPLPGATAGLPCSGLCCNPDPITMGPSVEPPRVLLCWWCGDKRPSCRGEASRHCAEGGRATPMTLVRFACFEKSSKATHCMHGVQDHRPQCDPADTFGHAARGQGMLWYTRAGADTLYACGLRRARARLSARGQPITKNHTLLQRCLAIGRRCL